MLGRLRAPRRDQYPASARLAHIHRSPRGLGYRRPLMQARTAERVLFVASGADVHPSLAVPTPVELLERRLATHDSDASPNCPRRPSANTSAIIIACV